MFSAADDGGLDAGPRVNDRIAQTTRKMTRAQKAIIINPIQIQPIQSGLPP
jgi:hypothetical protein